MKKLTKYDIRLSTLFPILFTAYLKPFTQLVNGFGGAYDFYQESLVVQNVYGAITIWDYSVDGTQF